MKFLRITFGCASCNKRIEKDILAENVNMLIRNLNDPKRCECGTKGSFKIENCKIVNYKPERTRNNRRGNKKE